MEELLQRLTRVEDREKSNTHRIGYLENRQTKIDELVTSMALLAEKQGTIEGAVEEMRFSIRRMEEKPAKRWEGIVDKVLITIIGLIVAYIAAKIGF